MSPWRDRIGVHFYPAIGSMESIAVDLGSGLTQEIPLMQKYYIA